jgi:hypothetical protein
MNHTIITTELRGTKSFSFEAATPLGLGKHNVFNVASELTMMKSGMVRHR